eukprot:361854_1
MAGLPIFDDRSAYNASNASNPVFSCSVAHQHYHLKTVVFVELYQDMEPEICTVVAKLLNATKSNRLYFSATEPNDMIQTELCMPLDVDTYPRNIVQRQPTLLSKSKGEIYLNQVHKSNFKLVFILSEKVRLPMTNSYVLCGKVIKGMKHFRRFTQRYRYSAQNSNWKWYLTGAVQLQKSFICHYKQSTFPFLTPLKLLTMIIPPTFYNEFYTHFPLTIMHEIISYVPLNIHSDTIGVKGMAFVLNQRLSTKFYTLAQVHTRVKSQGIEQKQNDDHYISSMIYFSDFTCGKKKIFLPFVRRDWKRYSMLKELKTFLIFGQSYKKYQRFAVHNIVNDELFVCCSDVCGFRWLSRRFRGFWIVDDGKSMVTLFRCNRRGTKRRAYLLCETKFVYNKYKQRFGMEFKAIHRLINKSKHNHVFLFDLDVQKYSSDSSPLFDIWI